MRSAKDILLDLGFNPDAPESTKQAFLKNLAKAASENQKADIIEPSFKTTTNRVEPQAQSPQLSFDSELLGSLSTPRLKIGS